MKTKLLIFAISFMVVAGAYSNKKITLKQQQVIEQVKKDAKTCCNKADAKTKTCCKMTNDSVKACCNKAVECKKVTECKKVMDNAIVTKKKVGVSKK